MRMWLKLMLGFGMLAAIAALLLWQRYQQFLQTPALNAAVASFDVPRGMGYAQMVAQLQRSGATGERWQWLLLARLEPARARLKAGEYAFAAGLKPEQVLEQMVRGRVKHYHFTIIEGIRFVELRRVLSRDSHLQQTLIGLSEAEIARRLHSASPALEGRFLPETYAFVRGDSDLSVLKRAHAAMAAALTQYWAQRDPASPLKSTEDLLKLASIVEKETGHGPERDEIAGVFTRRLKLGMKLQTDPTVIYGLGDSFDGNLTRKHLQTPTPYNSYTQFGLPPTPIALPGRASLAATIRPAPGNALYFVARGDGTSSFSATLDEHNRAVSKYQLKR